MFNKCLGLVPVKGAGDRGEGNLMPFALQIISFITDTLSNFLPLGLWMTPSGSIDSALSTAQTNIKKLLFGREDRLTPAQKLLRISEYLDLETKK